MRRKGALGKPVCPISHSSCKLCSLYRGRHYHAFLSCQEYLRRLHEAAAPKEKKAKGIEYSGAESYATKMRGTNENS